ncbi:hypothetical protein ACFV3E_41710 [Streptomyces sp. NPDC059718]
MSGIEAATARAITRDWARMFPAFQPWRPLRLLRRLGPLVQGITLERSPAGDDYLPTAHVHALTRDFPVVSLTLAQRLLTPSGVPERIKVARHDKDGEEAGQRLAGQSALPLHMVPTLDQVVERYRSFVAGQQRGLRLPTGVAELEDCVLLPAVAGRPDLSADALTFARKTAEGWNEPPHGYPGTGEWLDQLGLLAGDSGRLEGTVAAQTVKHKLTRLPDLWAA